MCGCTLNGSPAALPLRATIRKNHAVGTGIVRDATGSYQPGFCVGHRVLHLTRGVNLDSSTPQSAPCGRSDGQCLITILGPFSCPNWFAAR
jgi:hypothetical protein